MTTPEQLVTQSAVAEMLCLSERTIEGWRRAGVGPRFIRVSGKCVRYRLSDVIAWLEERMTFTEEDAP